MKTYKSKKDPTILIYSDGVIDPKFKTVSVTFPDGKVKILSSSTLTNQWEEIDKSSHSILIP